MKRPHPIAVALHYDGKEAPRVTAKGAGELAGRILALAREHEIPLHEDEALVEVLAQVELGEEIPESLYRAVAEIIAFVYMLKGKYPEGYGENDGGGVPSPSGENVNL